MKEIAKITTGSRLYGLETPESDHDYSIITLPSPREALFDHARITERKEADADIKVYPLHHFARLALAGNPSVIETLFAPEEMIEHRVDNASAMPTWAIVRLSRIMFLSNRIYPRFLGYARSESYKVFKDSGDLGAKRKEELAKHGYVPKMAASVLRLATECVQMLEDGILTFPLRDRDMIMSVKTGAVTDAIVKAEMERAIMRIEKAHSRSILPEHPPVEMVQDIITKLIVERG